jgi:hypothetical protein
MKSSLRRTLVPQQVYSAEKNCDTNIRTIKNVS